MIPPMTIPLPAPRAAAALAATLGLSAAAWVVTVLPRERPLGIRVRALLRRLEYRTHGDAAGAGRHECHLDGRDRRPRARPEAPACEGCHRCTARAGDRRAGHPDSHRARVRSRTHAPDVNQKERAVKLPRVESQDDWVAARKRLLVMEQELSRQRHALGAERRRLP